MTSPNSEITVRLPLQSRKLDVSRPYAFVNDQTRHYNYLRDHDLGLSLGAREKLDQLNPFLRNGTVMPGEVVVVSDGPAHMCTPEETQLMQLASEVRGAMIGMTGHDSYVMTQNFDMIQSIMSYGSIGIGASTAAWSQHLKGLEELLRQTETLHKRWRAGAITNDQFFALRKALFSRIEVSLKGIGRFGSGLGNDGKMKRILGISSKSYLHTGEIRDYTRKVRGVSRVASAMSKGTYVGIALDVGAGALEIQEACSAGREQECTKAKYVEGGKTAVGIGLAAVGGTAGTYVAGAVCLAIGIPTGGVGTLACAVIGGAIGAYGGGLAGAHVGELTGQKLYEQIER
jgi:hypothetical protein